MGLFFHDERSPLVFQRLNLLAPIVRSRFQVQTTHCPLISASCSSSAYLFLLLYDSKCTTFSISKEGRDLPHEQTQSTRFWPFCQHHLVLIYGE